MIKSFKELGEVLADFETRLLRLENSMPNIKDIQIPQNPIFAETEWSLAQWDTVQQMRAMILFLQSKLNSHLDKSKKKVEHQYK